ncbi:MAG: DUF456 domain-containing protein [Candidatus Harrisonbacteria bacterium]|nr:DUF456 domain-containing protein [Candidatus Harrisonbacteria bacterium]
MIQEVLLILLAFILVLSGAVGVIMPLLPGVPMAWFGMLIFGFATDFISLSQETILIFLGLTILTMVLDLVAPIIGAKRYRASKYGMGGAMLGLFLGFMMLGPIGIVAGPFIGALLGEMLLGKEPEEAMQSAKGAIIGFLAGGIIKLSLILVMLGFMLFSLF